MSAAAISVLAVTPELFPLVKTGGLADVAGALPRALAAEGVQATSLVPGYPAVMAGLGRAAPVLAIPDLFGGPASVLRGETASLDVMALDAPHLYRREGNPYVGPDGRDWPDNAIRFAALSAIAATLARGAGQGFAPDLVHAHDWQGGLTAAYLAYGGPAPPCVFTVHNLAFQGQFPASLLPVLGLPESSFSIGGIAHHGEIGFLKAGLQLADHVTTVSPTYAREIATEALGMGMDGVLRHRGEAFSGIINGIDTAIWDPATDPLIARRYDATRLDGKAASKLALQRRFGLAEQRGQPLFGVVSRLSAQKGLDLLLAALPILTEAGAQLVLLGAGDTALERAFSDAAARHPALISCQIGYDEGLAHLIQAGADALIVPSRFEPCGLTQLCALRYGTVPVVSRVGGLADTVEDGATGFSFGALTAASLAEALGRCLALYGDRRAFNRMARAGMARDVSWAKPAGAYAELYRSLIGQRSSLPPATRSLAEPS